VTKEEKFVKRGEKILRFSKAQNIKHETCNYFNPKRPQYSQVVHIQRHWRWGGSRYTTISLWGTISHLKLSFVSLASRWNRNP
jgi:hypothetical protein